MNGNKADSHLSVNLINAKIGIYIQYDHFKKIKSKLLNKDMFKKYTLKKSIPQ